MPLPLNEKVADALNGQLNTELQAGHMYRAMAAHFDSHATLRLFWSMLVV